MNTASKHHDVARWRDDQLEQAGLPAPPAWRVALDAGERVWAQTAEARRSWMSAR